MMILESILRADYAYEMKYVSNSVFVPEFPIDMVLNEAKKYIPSDKCFCPGGIGRTYIFKYDNCGRDCYHMTDYFKVICFNNTQNIVTVTPSNLNEIKFPFVDLNYLKDKENLSVNRVSQIDKFYKKYKCLKRS